MNSKNPSPGHKITAEISIHLDRGEKVVTLFIASDELPGTVITRARDPKAVAQLVDWYHAQDANTQRGNIMRAKIIAAGPHGGRPGTASKDRATTPRGNT